MPGIITSEKDEVGFSSAEAKREPFRRWWRPLVLYKSLRAPEITPTVDGRVVDNRINFGDESARLSCADMLFTPMLKKDEQRWRRWNERRRNKAKLPT